MLPMKIMLFAVLHYLFITDETLRKLELLLPHNFALEMGMLSGPTLVTNTRSCLVLALKFRAFGNKMSAASTIEANTLLFPRQRLLGLPPFQFQGNKDIAPRNSLGHHVLVQLF